MHGLRSNIRIQIDSESFDSLGDETKGKANSESHAHNHIS